MSRRVALRRLVPLAGALAMAACQAPTPIAAIDTSCAAFEPISHARADTEATRRQIRAHNAAWTALCGAAPAAR